MYSELEKAQIFRQFEQDIDYTIRIFYNQSIPQKDIKRCQDYIFCKLSMIKDILEQEGNIKEIVQLLNAIHNNRNVMNILYPYWIYIYNWKYEYDIILQKYATHAILLDDILDSFIMLSNSKPKPKKISPSKKGRKGFKKKTSTRKRKKKTFF